MSKELLVPAIVQQMVDAMQDKTNNSNIRHNYMVSVENIRDFCDKALTKYAKDNGLKKK
jgi:uncharacterized protein YutE (UPF0331/DUF86 family)